MRGVLLAGQAGLQHGLAHLHLLPAEEVRKSVPWKTEGTGRVCTHYLTLDIHAVVAV